MSFPKGFGNLHDTTQFIDNNCEKPSINQFHFNDSSYNSVEESKCNWDNETASISNGISSFMDTGSFLVLSMTDIKKYNLNISENENILSYECEINEINVECGKFIDYNPFIEIKKCAIIIENNIFLGIIGLFIPLKSVSFQDQNDEIRLVKCQIHFKGKSNLEFSMKMVNLETHLGEYIVNTISKDENIEYMNKTNKCKHFDDTQDHTMVIGYIDTWIHFNGDVSQISNWKNTTCGNAAFPCPLCEVSKETIQSLPSPDNVAITMRSNQRCLMYSKTNFTNKSKKNDNVFVENLWHIHHV